MKKTAVVVLVLTVLAILGPAIATSQYQSCEKCSWERVEDEVVFRCRYSAISRRTSCEELPTGCRWYACCGATSCGSFWV